MGLIDSLLVLAATWILVLGTVVGGIYRQNGSPLPVNSQRQIYIKLHYVMSLCTSFYFTSTSPLRGRKISLFLHKIHFLGPKTSVLNMCSIPIAAQTPSSITSVDFPFEASERPPMA